jgi:hypothetical protein
VILRPSTPYAEREVRAVHVEGAVAVDKPVAGFYRMRVGRNTVAIGINLWFGAPHDPVTGEELDRSWRWQALADDEPIDFNRIWPDCAADPITEHEYRRMVARKAWARQHAPDSAFAETGRRLDPLSTKNPLPF